MARALTVGPFSDPEKRELTARERAATSNCFQRTDSGFYYAPRACRAHLPAIYFYFSPVFHVCGGWHDRAALMTAAAAAALQPDRYLFTWFAWIHEIYSWVCVCIYISAHAPVYTRGETIKRGEKIYIKIYRTAKAVVLRLSNFRGLKERERDRWRLCVRSTFWI